VLVAGEDVVGVAASPSNVIARARRMKGTPLLLSIPREDKDVAAY